MLFVYICTVTKCHEIAVLQHSTRAPDAVDKRPVAAAVAHELPPVYLHSSARMGAWRRGGSSADLHLSPLPAAPGGDVQPRMCARHAVPSEHDVTARVAPECETLLVVQTNRRVNLLAVGASSQPEHCVCVRANACACSAKCCFWKSEHHHAHLHLLTLPGTILEHNH